MDAPGKGRWIAAMPHSSGQKVTAIDMAHS